MGRVMNGGGTGNRRGGILDAGMSCTIISPYYWQTVNKVLVI